MKIKSLVKRQSCKVLSLFAILSNVLLLLRPLEVPLFLLFVSVYSMLWVSSAQHAEIMVSCSVLSKHQQIVYLRPFMGSVAKRSWSNAVYL